MFIVATVLWTYKNKMEPIKSLLYLQCIQMMLSNFNKYASGTNQGGDNDTDKSINDGMTNFEALNFVQTMFPALFNMLNCLLITVL